MATTNEVILDRLVRHQVYIQRYGTSTVNRIMALLNRADADLFSKLQQRLSAIKARGIDTGPETTQRLKALLSDIRTLNTAAYTTAGKELTAQLQDLGQHEATWTGGLLDSQLPKGLSVTQPAIALVKAAATARPFQGKLLKEWLSEVEGSRAVRIRDAIRLGIVQGQTTDQIVRRVRGTKALGYADGLIEIDRRGVAAMVRTAINHTTSAARSALYAENADLIAGEQWHATLDPRTCPTCMARDGKKYPLGSGPITPAHIGCRCIRVPLLKSWRELGVDADEITPTTRASLNGQVPSTLTYNDWLRKQSHEFQDEALGRTRAELFRDGASVDQFVDRAGNQITLDQLRTDDPVPPPHPSRTEPTPSSGGTLGGAALQAENDAVEYVVSNGSRDGVEYAAAYFPDGTAGLRKTSMDPGAVSFTSDELTRLRGTTMVHNHPRGTSLSGEDLSFAAAYGIREIIAVPSFGSGIYRASPLMAWKDVQKADAVADLYMMRKLQKAYSAGLISPGDFDVLYRHLINLMLDAVGVVAYKANAPAALEAALAALGPEKVREIVEGFKWTP